MDVCSTTGLADRPVSPSQSEGVRVDAELRHFSNDLAIGTVTSSGSTLGLGRAAPTPIPVSTVSSRPSVSAGFCPTVSNIE